MPKLHTFAALAAVLLMLAFAAEAMATPVTVNVRVEGASGTLFEGPVTTDVHMVDGGDGTGQHPCDGTTANGTSSTTPAPTQTGALDDAAHANGFTWLGNWDGGFMDFFINKIGPDAGSSSMYWNLVRNWTSLSTGGCQQQVQQGDDLLFAFTGFDPTTFAAWPLLELSGAPARAAVGEQFTVHVVEHDGNGDPATPVSGATVGGATTNPDGDAVVSFDSSGNKTLKAADPNTIRSNAEIVCVYTPGSGDCGTQPASPGSPPPPAPQATPPQAPPVVVKDTTPPVVTVTSLVAGKVYDTGPRLLTGDADDSGGLAQVFLRLRATNGGAMGSAARCRWFSGKRGVFTHRTVPCSRSRFFRIGSDTKWSYLLPGHLKHGSYVLDVKVLDKAYNAGRASVPFAVR